MSWSLGEFTACRASGRPPPPRQSVKLSHVFLCFRLTATLPRILAIILNGTIAAGTVVLLHRWRKAWFIPCRALTHFHAKGTFGYRSMNGSHTSFATADIRMREPRSTRSRSVFRNAYLLARTMRAKFALALPSGSKPAATVLFPQIDVRVQRSTRHHHR